MQPTANRFPSRGSVARRPMSRGQAQAMLPPPPPGPNIGAWEGDPSALPQDVVGAVIGNLRTSMLDIGTANRLAGRGKPKYFGTVLESPQVFVAPSEPNSADNVRAGVKASGNARQALGKNTNRGRRGLPGALI